MRATVLCALLALLLFGGGASAQRTQLSSSNQPPANQASPEGKDTLSAEASVAYERTGWDLYHSQQYQEALSNFQNAISLNQSNANAYFGLGNCYYQLAQFREATESYQLHLALHSSAEGYYWLGRSLYQLQSYEAAGAAFQKAIQIKPDDSDTRLWLAQCFFKLKSYQQAAVEYQQVIELTPTNSYAHGCLGNSLYQLKSYSRAAVEYRQASELAPDNFDVHYWLGNALCKLKRFAEAADAYQQAIRIKPDDFWARYRRGYALMESLQFAEALPDLEKAHELKKGDRRAKLDLFLIYLATSEFTKAAGLYPVGYPIGVGAIVISFGLGTSLLLRQSFRLSQVASPGLAFAIGWILICFEGQLACTFAAGLLGLTYASGSFVAALIAAPLPLLIAALVAFPRQIWGPPFALPHSFPRKTLAIACLAMLLVYLGSSGYENFIAWVTHKPFPEAKNLSVIKDMIGHHPELAILIVVVLWPMVEEILFRGLLFGALRKWLTPAWTIVITAVLFATIHGDPYFLVPLVAVGILLGWVRHRTGSVWFSVVIHILNNALAFAFS